MTVEITELRQKLMIKGGRSLSDQTLLAIIIGHGGKNGKVSRTAQRVLKILDYANSNPDLAELCQVRGIGLGKAAALVAGMEFYRRMVRPSGSKIISTIDILPHIRHYSLEKQEHFLCISLTGGNEIIKIRPVTIGLVDKTHIHPREVYADPILERASAVIVAHHHISPITRPSVDDIKATKRLKLAGDMLGIRFLDHLIFNKRDFFSFQKNGFLGGDWKLEERPGA